MPKLEVRCTQAEWDQMEQARKAQGLDRSAWVHLHLFNVNPKERARRVNEEAGARRRATQARRTAALQGDSQPPAARHDEPTPAASPPARNGADPTLPSVADVALQSGLPYATAERYIEEGRIGKAPDGRLLIDGNPC